MSCNPWLRIELVCKASELRVPGAVAEGICCRAWRGGEDNAPYANQPSAAEIEITATKSTTIGPLGLYRDHGGHLALIGVLNKGQPIVIQKRSGGRTVGYVETVRAARFGDKLMLGGYLEDATPTNGALVTAHATPIYGVF